MGGILPALGFAITLMVIGKKTMLPFFIAGFFAVQYLKLDTMAMAIFAICAALLMNLFVPAGDWGRALSPEQLVNRIESYFQRNLSNDVTLNKLCEEMNYSKVYLCRIFKKMKNASPIDYFIQLKIEKASALFHECPGMSMKDVAESLGFSDSYYFRA